MLTASDAAKRAARHISEMTGRPPEGVVGVQRDEDGWRVAVEIVEMQRIPDSADILAVYEVEVDAGGELMSYRRTERHTRGQIDRD